ncbi:rho-associated protein kinase 1-like isoform X2 [Octopus sinensis]|nr:rho-associated protein kinase 1-like isoform X2 [Octopus sinensis]
MGHEQQDVKELRNLNSRFSKFTERNSFLQCELNSLKDDLKKRDADVKSIKEASRVEIQTIKEIHGKTNDQKNDRINTLEQELQGSCAKVRELTDMCGQKQNTIAALNDDISRRVTDSEIMRRQVQTLEKELDDSKNNIRCREDQLHQVKLCLEREISNRRIEAQRAETIQAELVTLKHDYEIKSKEYQELLAKQNPDAKIKKYWESELNKSKNEIRREYEHKLERECSTIKTEFESKIRRIRSEEEVKVRQMERKNKEIREERDEFEKNVLKCKGQINDLKSKLDEENAKLSSVSLELKREKDEHRADDARLNGTIEILQKENQDLLDANRRIEDEIDRYRSILDRAEN